MSLFCASFGFWPRQNLLVFIQIVKNIYNWCFFLDTQAKITRTGQKLSGGVLVLTPALSARQVRSAQELSWLPHSVRVKFELHKGSRSCLDSSTRCDSSFIHTRAHALVLTSTLSAHQVQLAQGLTPLSRLPHSVRAKFDLHKGSRSCLDLRTRSHHAG